VVGNPSKATFGTLRKPEMYNNNNNNLPTCDYKSQVAKVLQYQEISEIFVRGSCRWAVAREARVRSQTSACEICVGPKSSETGFSPSTPVYLLHIPMYFTKFCTHVKLPNNWKRHK
jgi:hypothetical protein